MPNVAKGDLRRRSAELVRCGIAHQPASRLPDLPVTPGRGGLQEGLLTSRLTLDRFGWANDFRASARRPHIGCAYPCLHGTVLDSSCSQALLTSAPLRTSAIWVCSTYLPRY